MVAPLLQIPPHYIPALAAFLRLSPEDLTAFLKALHEERPSLSLEDLADSIAARLSVTSETLAEIVSLLASLYLAREGLGQRWAILFLAFAVRWSVPVRPSCNQVIGMVSSPLSKKC